MAIDFTFPEEIDNARLPVRRFMKENARQISAEPRTRRAKREAWGTAIRTLRDAAKAQGLWCPHVPEEYGGIGEDEDR